MNARCKIMIVEDDLLFCEVLSELLETNGYNCLPQVHTYEDAKRQLIESDPDLVLIDIGLPGERDGIQLASYIYEFTQIPTVFITGYADAVTLQRAKKSHPRSIILKTKPIFDKKNLLDAIGDQLLASLLIASPDEPCHIKIKSRGLLLKVTEKKIEPVKHRPIKYPADTEMMKKTLIPFDDIQYIATNNKETRNTILIKPAGDLAYIYRESLANVEKELPDYFVRIRDSHVINIKKVTHCIGDKVLFIGAERYKVSENYQHIVHEKKIIYLSHLF